MQSGRPRAAASTARPRGRAVNGTAGPAETRVAHLDALAAELRARGWTTYLTTPAGRVACLVVQDPQDRAECGSVVAAPGGTTGDWWYWFGWAERIAPARAPGAAADAVIAALRRPGDAPGGRKGPA